MNHNPNDLKLGDKAILDADLANSSEVYIVGLSPKQMYARVRQYAEGTNSWEVMTNRLKPIK